MDGDADALHLDSLVLKTLLKQGQVLLDKLFHFRGFSDDGGQQAGCRGLGLDLHAAERARFQLNGKNVLIVAYLRLDPAGQLRKKIRSLRGHALPGCEHGEKGFEFRTCGLAVHLQSACKAGSARRDRVRNRFECGKGRGFRSVQARRLTLKRQALSTLQAGPRQVSRFGLCARRF